MTRRRQATDERRVTIDLTPKGEEEGGVGDLESNIFGGLTLIIHDKAFIQWKVTVLDWLLAAGLLASHYFGEQPFTQRLLGEHFIAERSTWIKLSHAWIAFLLALGGLNLYVA